MRIVELLLQGVRGSPGTRRVPLQPGLNVLSADGAPLPLAALVTWGLQGAAPSVPLGADGPSARIGLALMDEGGTVHRLLRDEATGRVRLLRRSADGFETLATGPGDVAAWLGTHLGVPDAEGLAALWVLGPDRSPGVVAPDPAALQARREELLRLRQAAERADALQFEADDLHRRLADLDARIERRRRRSGEREAAETRLRQARARVEVPEDLEDRLTARGEAVERRDAVLARLRAERDRLERGGAGAPAPAWRHPLVAGGVAGAVALLAVALLWPGLRGVAAAVPAVLGVGLAGVWRWTREGEAQERRARLLAALDERIEEAERLCAEAAAPVDALLEAGGFDDVEALRAHVDGVARLEAAVEALRDRDAGQEEEGSDPTEERAALAGRLEALEQELRGLSPEAARALEAERELAELDRALAWGDGGADQGRPDPWAPPDAAPGPEVAGPVVTALGALAGRAPAEVEARLTQRLPVWLGPLSEGALVARVAGGVLAVATAEGRPLPWELLTPGDRARVVLATRLAAAEAALAIRPGTLVLDRAFDGLPAAPRAWAEDALARLSRGAVVVYQSARPQAPGGGVP